MTLSNEDKLGIAQGHKRNIEYSKYNLELSLMLENCVTDPKEDIVASLTSEIAELDKKLTVLETEIASLTE
jgi:hypothetical protein